MKRFVKFEMWYFMDERPTTEVQVIEGTDEEDVRKNAEEWAKDLQKKWASGTFKFVSILSKEEASQCIEFVIDSEKHAPRDESQEIVDRITKLYKECYEED